MQIQAQGNVIAMSDETGERRSTSPLQKVNSRDSNPEIPAPKVKRPIRRASVACLVCRDRKIKCDGEAGNRREPCSQCKQLKQPCVFRFDDHRKRASSKAHIQRLLERIAALENGQGASPPKESDEDILPVSESIRTDPTIRNGNEALLGTEFNHFIPDQTTNQFSDFGYVSNGSKVARPLRNSGEVDFRNYADFSIDDGQLVHTTSEDDLMQSQFSTVNSVNPLHTLPLQCQEPKADVFAGLVEARSETIDRLCSTMGRLSVDETGQLRYFGSTSNLHVTSSLPPAPTPPVAMDQDLESLADSKQIQSHLLNLYFNFHNSQFQFVQQDAFVLDDAKNSESQFCSAFLLNCLLLRSVRLSDNLTVRKLDQVYLARAKQQLVGELDNPTVSSISAFCLLGDYIGGLGNDRAGWLYPGIAFRLLYDFGLNQDCADLVTMGSMSEKEMQIRHSVLWACYNFDKLLSIYQGRPSSLKLADISIPRPSYETVGPNFYMQNAWVELCSIVSDITDVVNGPQHILENPNTNLRLSRNGDRLLHWFKTLPPELQWKPKDALPAPSVCALHMQFFTSIILLHRPFAAYDLPTPRSSKHLRKPLAGYTPPLSRRICNENAIRISRLLLAYRKKYGVEKLFSSMLHMLFVAATTLISHISTRRPNEEEDSEQRKWLEVCLKALDDLTPSYVIAGRMLRVLISILESCGFPEFFHAQLDVSPTNRMDQNVDLQQQGAESIGRRDSFSAAADQPPRSQLFSELSLPIDDFEMSEPSPSSLMPPPPPPARHGVRGTDSYGNQQQGFATHLAVQWFDQSLDLGVDLDSRFM